MTDKNTQEAPLPHDTHLRHVCTADDPWMPEKGTSAIHPDAVSKGDTYDWSADHDDYETFVCPHCGLRFKVTLPN